MSLTKEMIGHHKVATKLSRLLGRKYNVNIVFDGNCATDGEIIHLPHWDFKDPANLLALYGVIAHEAGGHVRMTDFAYLEHIRTSMVHSYDPLLFVIFNILEDIRIEANLGRLYPGVSMYLDETARLVFLANPLDMGRERPPEIVILDWCLLTFRAEALGQTFLGEQQHIAQGAVTEFLSKDAMDAARAIGQSAASTGPDLKATLTIYMLAKELYQLVLSSFESFSSRKTESQGSNPETTSGNHENGDNTTQDRPAGQSQDGGSEYAFHKSKDSHHDALLSSLVTSDQSTRYDILNRASQLCQRDHDYAVDQPSAGCLAFSTEETSSDFSQTAQKAFALRSNIASALSPLLLGEVMMSDHAPSGRHLDQRRITRLMRESDPPVFRRRVIEEDQQISFMTLVDTSSSTKGATYHELCLAAIAVIAALDVFPEVEASIAYFPPTGKWNNTLGIGIIKDHNAPIAKCLRRWPTPSGGTPLHSAYNGAALHLLSSERERKVILTLTDGKPGNVPATRKAVTDAAFFGVEIYGLVLSSDDYPVDLFLDHEQINKCSDVPAAISRLVKRLL